MRAVWVCVLAFVGCSDPTQLVVVVDTDLVPLDEVVAIDIIAGGPVADTVRIELSERALPFSFVVAPDGNVDADVPITITALGADDEGLVAFRAVTGFRSGRSLLLEAPLARACRQNGDDLCGPDATCRSGECVDLYIDPATLPRAPRGAEPLFDGPSMPMDAGARCVDGVTPCEPACPCVSETTCLVGSSTCSGDIVTMCSIGSMTPFDPDEGVCEGVVCRPSGRECE